MTRGITSENISTWQSDFAEDPALKLAQNAVTQTTIDDVALNRSVVTSIDETVSNRLDTWPVTNQKKSGRCWMFAGMNMLRSGAMAKMGLEDFEFSQNYVLFFDKLERANYYLQAIIETKGAEGDDRTVSFLHDSLMGDGGQWNMFVALVRKYGLVPKSAMPESESSSATAKMNASLRAVLHEAARDIRQAGERADIDAVVDRALAACYRILCIHLGTPPTAFVWQWQDKEKKFHRDGEMTPQQFAAEYVTVNLDDYVCLVDDPRSTSPRGHTFTVKYLGNILGERVTYLNAEPEVLKRAAISAITSGEPVWFGCDVGKQMRRDLGIWDANLIDYSGVYQTEFTLDKAARLDYHETQMTHAMVLTGVDLDGQEPRKWRVENSWGDQGGKKGYYTMNDSWFGEYVFEIAARKQDLPAELVAALEEEPIELAPWDPMGALAG